MLIESLEQRTFLASSGTGLSAVYFNNSNFTGTQVARTDSTISFDWGTGSPHANITRDTFSARWTGQVKAAYTEAYTFKITSDDGAKLWIAGKLMGSTWDTAGASVLSASVSLKAAKNYDIKVEYKESTGSAKILMQWSSASTPLTHVPRTRLFPVSSTPVPTTDLTTKIAHAFTVAKQKIDLTLRDLGGSTSKFPSITNSNGDWKTVDYNDWTAGFFAGSVWQVYAQNTEKIYRLAATALTNGVVPAKTAGDDLGFRFIPSSWQLYQYMGLNKQVLIDAAASKVANFNSTVGMFESVNFKPSTSGNPNANFPVLMDHTMDLELVYKVAKLTNNSDWIAKSKAHLDKLAVHMVRPDGSTIQWGYFYDQTGAFVSAETRQGISGNTTWSRGQAWGMYSFAQAASELDDKYIATAKKLANYWIANTTSDGVPYWDFNATASSTTPKDSSAAAIAASALLLLASKLRGTADGAAYKAHAEKILHSLTSAAYLAENSSSRGVLLHGVKYFAQGIYDNSLSYGDYYFLEAMNRYTSLPL